MDARTLLHAPLRNIMIVGSAGSGKSTLARRLGEILSLRVVHVDHIYWKPNWVMRTSEEIRSLTLASIRDDGWIFEGNCSATYPDRIAQADTIIWTSPPRKSCVWHAIARSIRNYGKERPDMAKGCYDRLDWRFLRWVWNYPKNGYPKHKALFEKTKDTHAQSILYSQEDVEAFLEAVSALQNQRQKAV